MDSIFVATPRAEPFTSSKESQSRRVLVCKPRIMRASYGEKFYETISFYNSAVRSLLFLCFSPSRKNCKQCLRVAAVVFSLQYFKSHLHKRYAETDVLLHRVRTSYCKFLKHPNPRWCFRVRCFQYSHHIVYILTLFALF